MQLERREFLSPQLSEQPHKQPLEESKSWALISIFSSASLRAAEEFSRHPFFSTPLSLFSAHLPLLSHPTATHSQIMLLHSLKKANYQLPLLITDSGVPPLSNSTEVKVQVCVCKKNKMHCSSAHSHRVSLLMLLGTLLLILLCKYHQKLQHGSKEKLKKLFFPSADITVCILLYCFDHIQGVYMHARSLDSHIPVSMINIILPVLDSCCGVKLCRTTCGNF